ncbi:uncharacterized protein LOC127094302 [Lathyrus oleraceus]|uniref:uncharacterized protein LOC127094302 n=1 Tax=Pisum sativum TaxID=3888 RepID=UPI0021D3486E|nr:uncharacterized protein LOC127094302 [Pisum sativum]
MAIDASVSNIKVMNQDLVKLDYFDGTNFTHWQDKMMFLLATLNIHYVLDPDLTQFPEPTEDNVDEVKKERKKRKEDELLCRGHILNILSDHLYDLYNNTQSTKEIWKALEIKFKVEEEARTSQQNGLAERKNRTYQEMINTMLMHSELPFNMWGEALPSVCLIMNIIPLKLTDISPYEIWKGRLPNIGYLRVWGCVVCYKNMDPKRTKLGPQGIICDLIGYASNNKACRLLNLESNVTLKS